MASRANKLWRSVADQRRPFVTVTAPRMKLNSPAAGDLMNQGEKHASKTFNADMIPIYAIWGFVALVGLFGVHTVKQQIVHSPTVSFSKKRREEMPVVSEPDWALSESEKLIKKSFFRRLAHIQIDGDRVKSGVSSDPTRANPFSGPKSAESLKSVGVDPRGD
ncbi:uncharacterized protein LOC109824647 [Asparagus officinalis]|uniref:uncharacterized protein LOC109824647 n=1 Tax=Asparagus officinalis TaxID=4686 RepID=UPI00098E3415|nr:uncharacterized protein LOC109824647 [Asparagus officinalis]